MNRKKKLSIFPAAALSFVFLVSGCQREVGNRTRTGNKILPPVILWAWERPEDLEFLDSERFGVAFLAQTLILKGDDVILNPRHQPLKVSSSTRLVAVTRIESQKNPGQKAALNPSQRERLVSLIARTRELQNVSAIQVDFDAARSEREFYRGLLQDLRQRLPEHIALSMTALASFCIGDRWLDDLPVDEAVPMIFRMGTDDRRIKRFLSDGNDFLEPLCRTSYGIALDEPLEMEFAETRRLYVFHNHAWTKNDLALLEERMRK